jgi:hypothetical protein
MKVLKRIGISCAALALAGLFGVESASASIIGGRLDVANCAGGGVSVSLTTIDWQPPAGGPNGCIATGLNTNIAGVPTLGPAVVGTILDLSAGGGAVPNFMVFGAYNFTLLGFGPGVSNTACSTTNNAANPACSVVAGSPFILSPGSLGTSITLPAFGTVSNGTAPGGTWSGSFTTQIAGLTPSTVQSTILGGGSVASAFSGDFTIVGIPEPAAMFLIGGGLLALAAVRRFKAARS